MPEDHETMVEAPYGSWSSPVTAASLAEGSIALSDLRVFGGRPYWLESRPAEGGRLVVMTLDGEVRALTPEGFNARTRVHEYGGAPFVVAADGGLWFSHHPDQRLYRQADGAAPEPMTPEGYRYADAVPAPGGGLIAVREDHTAPAVVRNAIVRLSGDVGDAGEVLFGESDFVAYPRVSPDGRRLAWIAWDFPDMPWDATRLYVAGLKPSGLAHLRVAAGGPAISVLDPQWAPDGALTWISDEGDFWNLYDERGGCPRSILPRAAEFAAPLWTLGRSHYTFVGDKIVAAAREDGREGLLVIDPACGTAEAVGTPFSALVSIRALEGTRVAAIGHSATDGPAVVLIDVATGTCEVERRRSPVDLRPGDIAVAEPISFASAGGRTAHALFYPPTNAACRAPRGERPPLIVQAHGGPTGSASSAFNLAVQYWTSRGFAFVDVDYGGSCGYGRAYRERLKGQWGVVDVEDVVAAARHLADAGRVDPARIAIRGQSAGGFTVLAALSQSSVFAAGVDVYGVADLEALAKETHKFESRYLDGLIGPWPAARALYQERSPINHLEGLTAPLLILQGAKDPVVPPNQAHAMRDALKARAIPVAFLEFAEESHGFRRTETIVQAKEAELDFCTRVFGVEPADRVEPVEIEGPALKHPS